MRGQLATTVGHRGRAATCATTATPRLGARPGRPGGERPPGSRCRPGWPSRSRASLARPGRVPGPDGRPAPRSPPGTAAPPDEVLLTAGAAEAFVLLARALRPRRAGRGAPAVHRAGGGAARGRAPRSTGCCCARRTASGSTRRWSRPTPTWSCVGNPTNPTSVLHPAADGGRAGPAGPGAGGRRGVRRHHVRARASRRAESLAGRRDLPGLVVLRSLTKTWGLAGLRVGYLLGRPRCSPRLAAAQPLWPVSTPALAAADACASPAARRGRAARSPRELAADRDHLVAAPAGRAGRTRRRPTRPARSCCCAWPARTGCGAALRGARLRGAARRHLPGLGPDWLRIAVRDPATTDAFARRH